MGNEDFAYCLLKFFDVLVDRLQMKYICQGIIDAWSKQSKKQSKNKMGAAAQKTKKSFNMPAGKSVMSISPTPQQESKLNLIKK